MENHTGEIFFEDLDKFHKDLSQVYYYLVNEGYCIHQILEFSDQLRVGAIELDNVYGKSAEKMGDV